jgi:hypothetical protein
MGGASGTPMFTDDLMTLETICQRTFGYLLSRVRLFVGHSRRPREFRPCLARIESRSNGRSATRLKGNI